MDFHLWGTIRQSAPTEFAVTVSAVPASGDIQDVTVDLRVAPSQELAESIRASMLLAMGERVRARGDRVVDVEE
jgi:hypothetical protein